jgi:hypothetical protein
MSHIRLVRDVPRRIDWTFQHRSWLAANGASVLGSARARTAVTSGPAASPLQGLPGVQPIAVPASIGASWRVRIVAHSKAQFNATRVPVEPSTASIPGWLSLSEGCG